MLTSTVATGIFHHGSIFGCKRTDDSILSGSRGFGRQRRECRFGHAAPSQFAAGPKGQLPRLVETRRLFKPSDQNQATKSFSSASSRSLPAAKVVVPVAKPVFAPETS